MNYFIKQAKYFDSKIPEDIYKPSSFWSNLIKKNYKLIFKGKIHEFRNLKIGFVGFAPYFSEIPRFKIKHLNIRKLSRTINSFKIIPKGKKKILNLIFSSINGQQRAYNLYKILLTDKIKPFFYNFNESLIGKPTESFKFDKKNYSASSLNYLTGLLFLKNHIGKLDNKIFLEIGGGFGTVGEILYKLKIKNFKYINFDLPPLNIISEYYLRKSCNQKIGNHFSYLNNNKIYIKKLKKLNSFPNFDIEKLSGKIDIFLNFISFQEMEHTIVSNYIDKIFKLNPKFILLRNLREGKNTSKNKNKYKHKFSYFVKKPIKKNDYIRMFKKKYVLVDCNVDPYGYKTWDNYNSELMLFKKK